METFVFIWENLASIARMTVQHLEIVGTGVGLAIVTGVPLGIVITLDKRLAKAVLYLVGTIIDYETTKLASKFVFRNPNETDACGCGESVTINPASAD